MKQFLTALLLAGLLLPAIATGTARAQQDCEDRVVIGDSFTLQEGDTFGCDIVVVGGSLTIEEGATVTETVMVMGGNVRVSGEVEEDIVVFGGSVELEDSAVVDGRLVTVGGSVSRDDGAVVSGGESDVLDEEFNGNYDFDFDGYPFPRVTPFGDWLYFSHLDPLFATLWHGMEIVGGALAMSLIALLVVAVWPDPTRRVSAAIVAAPAAAGGLGLLTLVAVPVLLVMLSITILLIPVALLGALLFGMAIVFGWLALGAVVGERLTVALNRPTLSPALATALGTLLVSLVMGIIGLVPCLGTIVQVVFGAIGLGAVVLTRFGMTPYQSGPASTAGPAPAAPAPPPPPEPPPPAPRLDPPTSSDAAALDY